MPSGILDPNSRFPHWQLFLLDCFPKLIILINMYSPSAFECRNNPQYDASCAEEFAHTRTRSLGPESHHRNFVMMWPNPCHGHVFPIERRWPSLLLCVRLGVLLSIAVQNMRWRVWVPTQSYFSRTLLSALSDRLSLYHPLRISVHLQLRARASTSSS